MTTVELTDRQAKALANLLETGRRVGMRATVEYGKPSVLLTHEEMDDLLARLKGAVSEERADESDLCDYGW